MSRRASIRPPLEADFDPVILRSRDYDRRVEEIAGAVEVVLEVLRGGKPAAEARMRIFPHEGPRRAENEREVRRRAKLLLWKTGGERIALKGCSELSDFLSRHYAPGGRGAFDQEFFSRIFDGAPVKAERRVLGGHWDGCRVGFDLGASDRKCAAVKDGRVVHSEEVPWDPASFGDPRRHIEEIRDSIRRAAGKLPRVDAIGGCAAGIIVGDEVRRSTLFRGVPEDDFNAKVGMVFREVLRDREGVPFALINDGAVTALVGAQRLGPRPVLGLALGSSLAAGCADAAGSLPDTIDELAFVPIDARADAPVDDWSGERGCGVDYLSQRAVERWAVKAGLEAGASAAETLARVQERMADGDARARDVYRSVGVCLGYAVAQYGTLYERGEVLLLGRELTGPGGEVILEAAQGVLKSEFPELSDTVALHTVGEKEKRHGQAVAAASLPPGKGA